MSYLVTIHRAHPHEGYTLIFLLMFPVQSLSTLKISNQN